MKWSEIAFSAGKAVRCLHSVSRPLEHEEHEEGVQVSHCSYLTYSFLFSSVTGILRPLGLSSCCKNFPKALCSTQNVWSRTEVMSFSLHKEHKSAKMENLSTLKRGTNAGHQMTYSIQTRLLCNSGSVVSKSLSCIGFPSSCL